MIVDKEPLARMGLESHISRMPELHLLRKHVNAVDYLLKPVTYQRLARSISRFQRLQEKAPESTYSYFKVNGKLLKSNTWMSCRFNRYETIDADR